MGTVILYAITKKTCSEGCDHADVDEVPRHLSYLY